MIAFPAAAALIALACAGFMGWDAVKRPRPERLAWFVAFLVFAAAASAEVLGATLGWTPTLARLYYLAGAVLVVGILALGELYLLWPNRMPAVAPGIALLIAAIAATAVWSAPLDPSRLGETGWHAIERGPFLVALAASINAGGTLVLVGGALYSAVRIRSSDGSRRRAAGCVLIALGTVVVALGGTLTRFGRPEYLYLAMSAGIAIIFSGVLLTRPSGQRALAQDIPEPAPRAAERASRHGGVTFLPTRDALRTSASGHEGLRFVSDHLLPLDNESIADACRRWSATPIAGDTLTREQARQTWALRIALPDSVRDRFDRLPLVVQAQIGELYHGVWSVEPQITGDDFRAGARRPLAILHPANEAEGEAR